MSENIAMQKPNGNGITFQQAKAILAENLINVYGNDVVYHFIM